MVREEHFFQDSAKAAVGAAYSFSSQTSGRLAKNRLHIKLISKN